MPGAGELLRLFCGIKCRQNSAMSRPCYKCLFAGTGDDDAAHVVATQSVVKCGMQFGKRIFIELPFSFAFAIDDDMMYTVFGMGKQVFELYDGRW